jgi:hypothetical protein
MYVNMLEPLPITPGQYTVPACNVTVAVGTNTYQPAVEETDTGELTDNNARGEPELLLNKHPLQSNVVADVFI